MPPILTKPAAINGQAYSKARRDELLWKNRHKRLEKTTLFVRLPSISTAKTMKNNGNSMELEEEEKRKKSKALASLEIPQNMAYDTEDLKKLIELKFDLPIESQVLYSNGHYIKPGEDLSSRLHHGGVLEVTLALKGGINLRKKEEDEGCENTLAMLADLEMQVEPPDDENFDSESQEGQIEGSSGETVVLLGQYSAPWLTLSLIQAKVPIPPMILVVEKHFAAGPFKSAKWGQTQKTVPFIIQSILAEMDLDIPSNECINFGTVYDASRIALDKIKQSGILVYEVEKIEDVAMDEHGDLYIDVTIDKNDARQQDSMKLAKPQDGKFRLYLKKDAKNFSIINTLKKPKKREIDSRLDRLVNINQFFNRQQHANPKIVFGSGPSVVWVKETFGEDRVVLVGNQEKFKNTAQSPRCFETAKKIDVFDEQETLDRTDVAENLLQSNIAENVKAEVRQFLGKYPHLNASEVAVILDGKKESIQEIGQGINAIGDVANEDIFQKNLKEKVRPLHLPAEDFKTTIAPAIINGSLINTLNWQILNLPEPFKLSLEHKMLLMPFEQLLMAKEHCQIFTLYMREFANLEVNQEFFVAFRDEIVKESLCKSLPTSDSVEDLIVRIFNDVHKDVTSGNRFKEAINRLMVQKQKKILLQK